MQFFSTRDQNRKVTSSQAIAQGLSDEGGLFVPESFPQVDVKALCGLDYPALAAAVVREYLTDYDPAFLTEATRSTYGAAFGGKAGYLAPVEGDTYALELWHGPTCAVKDYALQKALSGTKFTGFKVVEGRSNRKYTDEDAVAKAVEDAGYEPYEKKLLGITAMSQTLGRKKFEELLGGLVYKPPGKPVLVPESDKRPAMNTAINDFKENEEDNNYGKDRK